MASNLFEDLKAALADFKTFLDANVGTIKPAIQQIAALIPQVTELITGLRGLMTSIKTEIQNLDVAAIPGLAQVSAMTGQINTLLSSAKNLLPDQAGEIDTILGIADVVTGLPSLDAIKGEIVSLIDAINGHLTSLQAP